MPLFRRQELAFRTQYAELKERTRAAGPLLPGTPGTLALRRGTGRPYWYRVFYPVPGKQSEELVGREDDPAALSAMRERIAFAEWSALQVSSLRKLGFQVADKPVARVLVELHNRGAFEAGLVLVGTFAYLAWLNEFGAVVAAARTQDIDLARHQPLKLAAPLSFLQALDATALPFVAVPGMPSEQPSTSVKLPGLQGLRIDVLTAGRTLGRVVRIPELDWHAQTVPHYDYLLADPEPAAFLAGGHCVPVRLPQAARLVWHKFYAAGRRRGFPEKSAKDIQQALTLAACLLDFDDVAVAAAWSAAPASMRSAVRQQRKTLLAGAAPYPELSGLLGNCLDRD